MKLGKHLAVVRRGSTYEMFLCRLRRALCATLRMYFSTILFVLSWITGGRVAPCPSSSTERRHAPRVVWVRNSGGKDCFGCFSKYIRIAVVNTMFLIRIRLWRPDRQHVGRSSYHRSVTSSLRSFVSSIELIWKMERNNSCFI